MSERFPRRFGDYILLKSLTRGGMGEIYLAAKGVSGGLDKLCVLKKVIPGRTNASKVNRFLDEARAVLRLSHGNLVSTFDAGTVDGELFIAMEQVEGKDLREIWNRCARTRTRIPLDVALVVARELTRALTYVHTYGDLRVVHRDVAPPNILLSYFGEVKLTDFGLARSILKTEHTSPGVVFGRASYLSPEQARGEVADARTDIYSLGIVTWELLTGQPYLRIAGLDPAASLAVARNPAPEPPSVRAPWVGADLDELVLRALAPDRRARFPSADEFRRALTDVMSRVTPMADVDRVAQFLRGLYGAVMDEERIERERLVREALPRFRGELPPALDGTPITSVFAPPEAAATGTAPSTGASEGEAESLHVSAQRARADFKVRRSPEDASSAHDLPTRVWRKAAASSLAAGRGPDVAAAEVGSTDGGNADATFVGRVIANRYWIHRRIGEGGMGTVYAAEHVEIGKSVAVKILRREHSGDEEVVERFRREARAASRVGHPHIIDVTDFGTTADGCAFFVMELLDGMDLADVLAREARLGIERAVHIAVQVCRALQAAHDAGIIHRDLKPENIFLVSRAGETDFVKVLDFGIARNLAVESSGLTHPGMALGTPEYMAPEQAMARPVDHRADVYALGAMTYEMVLGVAPYKDGPPEEILDRKSKALASMRLRRPEVSAGLDAVIRRALQWDPDARPQTMAQLEYELVKTVWGRGRAVADMMGLRPESRIDADTPVRLTGPMESTPRLRRSLGAGGAGPAPDLARVPPAGPAPDEPGAASTGEAGPRGGEPVAVGVDVRGAPDAGGRAAAGAPPSRTVPPAASAWASPPYEAAPTPASFFGRGARPVRSAVLAGVVLLALVAGARWLVGWPAASPSSASKGIARLVEGWRPSVAGATATRDQAPPPTPWRESQPSNSPRAGAPPTPPPSIAMTLPVLIPDAAGTSPASVVIGSSAGDENSLPALRDLVRDGAAAPADRRRFADALVAAGWQDVKAFRWHAGARRAREALAQTHPRGEPSRGARALLGEALYALHDFRGALEQFGAALEEKPGDPRLERRILRARRQLRNQPGSLADRAASEPTAEQ